MYDNSTHIEQVHYTHRTTSTTTRHT